MSVGITWISPGPISDFPVIGLLRLHCAHWESCWRIADRTVPFCSLPLPSAGAPRSSAQWKMVPSKVDHIAALEPHERKHLHLKKELGNGLITDLLILRRFELEESWLRRDGHHEEICAICESILAHV